VRVLHVVDSLEPGGAERQLELLLRSFPAGHVTNSVCALHRHGVLEDAIRREGTAVVGLRGNGRHDELPRLTFELARVIRDFRPDLLHTSLAHADMVGAAAGVLTSTPHVATICAQFGSEQRSNGVAPWRIEAVRLPWSLALRRATRCIAVSKAVRDGAIRSFRLDPTRTRVIYRADKPVRTRIAPREEIRSALGIPESAFLFINVGRLVPGKGQDDVLRAFSRMRTTGQDVRLIVAGEGVFRTALESIVTGERLDSSVSLLGARDDVPSLLHAADAFVFPSRSEGFSGALLEAMSAGLPCVVCDIAPMTEAITQGETGLCVPLQDVDALAEAMCRLAADRAYAAQLGEAARRDARSRFDPREVALRTLDVYREVVDNAPSNAGTPNAFQTPVAARPSKSRDTNR
jgi:glycosyltransferase involved in cell wall biosynthesis